MPISVEQMESGPVLTVGGNNESAELRYVIQGSYTDTAVYAVIAALAPTTYTSPATGRVLYRQHFQLSHEEVGIWRVTVPYGPTEPKESGDAPDFSFDISTDSVRITQAIETISRYPAAGGGAAPDLKGAIGWNGEEAEGVDIIIPKCTLSYKVIVDDADMTDAFKRDLSKLVGKTNDATWKDYDEDELLLTGISGRYRYKEQDWELNFSIAVSEGKTGLTIGALTGINKPGWAYLDVKYKKSVSGANKILEPEFVYIQRVYDQGDFDTLPL